MDALAELLGLFRGLRGVDTTRVHHDGGDIAVEALAEIGALRHVFQRRQARIVFVERVDGHAADRHRDDAHQADDRINLATNFHGRIPQSRGPHGPQSPYPVR